jgi:hypothetical protein
VLLDSKGGPSRSDSVRISSYGDELPRFFDMVSMGKMTMVHLVLATGPRLGRAMRIEGRGEPGRLFGVTGPWDAQWKGAAEPLLASLGRARGKEKGEAGWAGSGWGWVSTQDI